MTKRKIFYAWNSDAPPDINKEFIWDCLERAIKKLKREGDVEVCQAVRDTRGARGMVDIVNEIFRRIDECDLIVADVSNVNPNAKEELVPNPNVMFEFGYALGKKGELALIGIANTAFGPPERLPFDINKRSITAYELHDAADRLSVRDELVTRLARIIKTNLGEQREERRARHSAGIAALMEVLIDQTDLPDLADGPVLPKRAASALELARKIGQHLHDEMGRAFVAMLLKAIETLENAIRIEPNEENLPRIRKLLDSAYDDIDLGSRDFMEGLRMDDASLEGGLVAVEQLAQWFHDSAERFKGLGAAEVGREELVTYDTKTFELRKASLFRLMPSHPEFAEKLEPLSLSTRRDFLTNLRTKQKNGAAMAQAAQSAAAALSRLLAEYGRKGSRDP